MEKSNTNLRIVETQADDFNHLIESCFSILNQKLTDGFHTPEAEKEFYQKVLPLYIFLNGFIQQKSRESHQYWVLGRYPVSGIESAISWTGSKAEAVELIYALTHAGVFNNGQVTTKMVIDWFEVSLEIGLGNTSKIFQEIRNRKKNIASLIGKMDKALLGYIDQLDNEESARTGFLKRA